MMDSGGIPMTMPVQPANSGNNNGNNGWGGDSWWIILLFICLFGWGGFGGYGGFGNGGGASNPGLQGLATRADVNEGFALNNLQGGINAIQQGICDATYALNEAIRGGFSNMQLQICNLGAQLQQCCCDIRTAIQEVNYNMSMQTNMLQNTMCNNTRDVIENQNSNARAVLDKLAQMEYNSLNDKYQAALAENQSLRFQASQTAQNAFIAANQDAQTAEILRRTGNDCPTAAYIVQPPTPVSFPTNCCGQFNGYGGYNSGCGNCNGCGNF